MCGQPRETKPVRETAVQLSWSRMEGAAQLAWPPNHKFRLITLSGGEELELTIDSVTQDEPVNDTGHGKGAPDARWVDDRTDAVYLRAERSGRGDGRTYRIRGLMPPQLPVPVP